MKKFVAILMAMIMVMSVTVVLASGVTDKDTQPKVAVIIGFKDKPSHAGEDMIRGHGGDIKYSYTIINAIAAKLPDKAIAKIGENPRVAYVEMDAEVHALDEELNNSWGVKRIGAGVVHDGGNNGTGVKVAIIDTGIDYNHPDLDANFGTLLGYDFVNDDDNPMDDAGHGTHCAGIVAAEDNGEGVVGVAPNASLYAVKVLNKNGRGWTSDVIAGIEWTIDPDGNLDTGDRMDVISMSFGGGYSEGMEDACNKAYNAGIVVVASAGNSGPGDDTVGYPAKYYSVIAVSATNDTDTIAPFSSRGPEVELAAPGVSINSTVPGGYDIKDGTSMACPHVAGTAALVIASGTTTDNDEVRTRLWNTAEDLGNSGLDTKYGYGLVDAEVAAASTVTLELIAVTPETASIPKGLTRQYTAEGTYSDSSTLDITFCVNWTSSDTGVATIDSAGLATGEDIGNTSITASSNSISDTATLRVLEPTVSVDTISYSTKGGREGNKHLLITVALIDDLHNSVADASVSIKVYLEEPLLYGSYTGMTGTDGTVTFKANNAPSGNYTTTVTNVTADGLTWDGDTPDNSYPEE